MPKTTGNREAASRSLFGQALNVAVQMIASSLVTVHRTCPAMGTLFEALLVGDDREHLTAVADAALAEVQRIDRLLSRFNPRSEISRVNRLAGEGPLLVDYELAALLATCIDARQMTGGAFDITAKSRCGVQGEDRHLTAQLTAPASLPHEPNQMPGIFLNRTDRVLKLTEPGVWLDLGGIGKGYALDRAAQVLDEQHVEHSLLQGGTSSVLARGSDASGEPWRVKLRHGISEHAGVLRLRDAALSCSEINDTRDIVDPASGRPVAGAAAVAVVAPTATQAEVLSTALVCLGRECGERVLQAQRDGAVSVVWHSPGC